MPRPHLVGERFLRRIHVRTCDAADRAIRHEEVDCTEIRQDWNGQADEAGQRSFIVQRGTEQRAHLGEAGRLHL